MPIYEYVCESCGHEYEKIVLSKSAEIACPKCESRQSKQKLSVFTSASTAAGKSGSSFQGGGGGCCGGACGCH